MTATKAVFLTVAMLMCAVGCGPITPTVSPKNVVDVGDSPKDGVVQPANVSITFGRAVLDTDGRVTLFYVAEHMPGDSGGAAFINTAVITSPDARSWSADGYGTLFDQPPLTLGWLTFPVSKDAKGNLRVTVNSVQTDDGNAVVSWQLEQLDGLVAQAAMSEAVIFDSDICVGTDSVAFGFHEKACATEFVDPHALRQRGSTPRATRVAPRPRPTPIESTTPILPPRSTLSPMVGDMLLFTLCTPWHLQIQVEIENVETPEFGGNPPTTSSRCLLP